MEIEELEIEVWHPEHGAEISVSHPIKTRVYFRNPLNDKDRTRTLDIASYSMTWSVDDEKQNQMQRDYGKEGDHFRANLDSTNWKWNFSGYYQIGIRAEIPELGVLLAKRSVATPNRWRESPSGDNLTLEERRTFQEGWAFATARNQGKDRFPVNPKSPAWLSELAQWLGYSPFLPAHFDFYAGKVKPVAPPTVIESRTRLKEFASFEEMHAAAVTLVVTLLMGDEEYSASSQRYQTLLTPYLHGYHKEQANQIEQMTRMALKSVGYTL